MVKRSQRNIFILRTNLFALFATFAVPEAPSMIVHDKQGLKITFKLERSLEDPDLLIVHMVANNSGLSEIKNFLLQVAVPKVVVQ